ARAPIACRERFVGARLAIASPNEDLEPRRRARLGVGGVRPRVGSQGSSGVRRSIRLDVDDEGPRAVALAVRRTRLGIAKALDGRVGADASAAGLAQGRLHGGRDLARSRWVSCGALQLGAAAGDGQQHPAESRLQMSFMSTSPYFGGLTTARRRRTA